MEKDDKVRVVVGIDFTGASDVALQQAIELAKRGAMDELHAVYVVEPGDLPDHPEKSAFELAEEVLDKAPAQLRTKVIDVATASGVSLRSLGTFVHVRIGDHAKTLHQVAVDYDADLIIVGTHNRKLVDRLVLGSVSESLVRTAHCPVLVAREKDFSKDAKTVFPDQPYKEGETPTYEEDPTHIVVEQVVWSPSGVGAPTGVRIV